MVVEVAFGFVVGVAVSVLWAKFGPTVEVYWEKAESTVVADEKAVANDVSKVVSTVEADVKKV